MRSHRIALGQDEPDWLKSIVDGKQKHLTQVGGGSEACQFSHFTLAAEDQ